jgi:hypothetical protein
MQNGYTALINPTVPSANIQNYPFIAGSGDTVAVVWQESSSGNTNVYCAWSVTGSADLFNNIVPVNSSMGGIRQNPHIAYANGVFHFVFTDASNGNVVYRKATITSPSSIDEQNGKLSLRAYPNPSNGNVTLDLAPLKGGSANVKLVDVTGRTIEIFSTNGESRLVLPQQTPGVYFVEVTAENKSIYTTRVVFY